MKAQTLSSFIALAAGLQQVTATGWNDFPSFKCPKNSCDKCTSQQTTGFDWSGLGFGSFSSYGGFDFSGFTCGNSLFKRDELTGRTFSDKCIRGSASSEPQKCPHVSCGDVDSFSIDVLEISVEFDCDLEFHYGMGDGSTCKQKSSCSKSGTTVKNTQCGGAKNVTVVLPSPPENKPTCSVGIHSIGFNCPSSCTSTTAAASTPESISTTSTAAETTSTSAALTTSESSTSSVYTTAASTSTTPIETSSTAAGSTTSTSATETTTSITEESSTSSSVEGTTSTSSTEETTTSTSSTEETTSTSTTGETTSTSSAEEITSTSSSVETTSIYVSETSSVVYSTSSEETSAATTTSTPAETITTVIVETTVTTCPVTNTYTTGGTTSTEVTQTVSTITTTRTSTVCDKCDHAATSTTSATEVAPVSSVSPPQPTSNCPAVLPSCLKTWLSLETNCQGSADYACFCPNSNLTNLVFECLSAHGASDDEVSAAQGYFQGICAEFVPQNPGLITAAPTLTATAVVTGPVTTIAVYTTVVVPCTESNGPASTTTVISSAVTVPQVVFTTVTGTGVGLVPGSAAAVTTAAAVTAAATPAPTYAQTTLATVAPTYAGSNGTGTLTASSAQFTGAASRSGVTFSVVGAAALVLSFFAM